MKRFSAYRDHQVFNAPNEQLVVMLFETAIHRLQRAKDGMVSGHWALAWRGAKISGGCAPSTSR